VQEATEQVKSLLEPEKSMADEIPDQTRVYFIET